MKPLLQSLQIIASRKDARTIIIVSTLAFLFALLLAQNGKGALDAFSLGGSSFFEKVGLMLEVLFDIKGSFTAGSLILATLGSFLGGINLSMAYVYVKTRGDAILKSGLYSGMGLVLAFLGVGCAACGTALLSVVLGFFGFSAMLGVLPYQGQEIGYVGLIILCIATYSLAKKVVAPNVC